MPPHSPNMSARMGAETNPHRMADSRKLFEALMQENSHALRVFLNSIVRDSIISDQATVTDITIEQSIIGENGQISGKFASINIGDASIVKLSR